jgi:hypothetical protein
MFVDDLQVEEFKQAIHRFVAAGKPLEEFRNRPEELTGERFKHANREYTKAAMSALVLATRILYPAHSIGDMSFLK